MDRNGNDLLVLDMNSSRHEIQGRFGCSVHRVRDRRFVRHRDTAGERAHDDEFPGFSRCLQQWRDGLEQQDDSDHIGAVVLIETFDFCILHCWVCFHDAGIGDDNIQRRDFMLGLELLDSLLGIGLHIAVELDDNDG